jgi:hypothetical protein
MYNREEKARYTDLTITQARTMRAHYARLAAVHAERVEQARAAGQYAWMAHCLREYKRSTFRCRVLGEVIRGQLPGAPEPPREREHDRVTSVVQLGPTGRKAGIPTTGAAA